jgi:peptidoglycan hydrolase-like protein with peptidoglycan-binding domain
METLGYLHLACVNELPEDSPPLTRSRHLGLLNGLNWQKFSSAAWVKFLSLAISLSILSLASSAMALLQRGDSGASVSDLQSRLAAAGCYNGEITGVFGPRTEEAVIECQRRNGLVPDGIVGPATEAILQGNQPSQTFNQNSSTFPVQNITTTSYSGVLQRGDSGEAVADLQRRLSAAGYYRGTIDGIFGQQTEDAVIRLQQDRRLRVDGIAGSQVAQALTGTNGNSSPSFPSGTSLTIGDSGSQVETLQRRLKDLGYFDSSVTGYYGSLTRDAVLRYQRDRGLPATGIADARTLNTIGGVAQDNNNPNRFVVVVPKQDESTLFRVRQFVPSAFTAKSRLGDYILAGRFSNQARAEQQSNLLRQRGLDARVAYQPLIN